MSDEEWDFCSQICGCLNDINVRSEIRFYKKDIF